MYSFLLKANKHEIPLLARLGENSVVLWSNPLFWKHCVDKCTWNKAQSFIEISLPSFGHYVLIYNIIYMVNNRLCGGLKSVPRFFLPLVVLSKEHVNLTPVMHLWIWNSYNTKCKISKLFSYINLYNGKWSVWYFLKYWCSNGHWSW